VATQRVILHAENNGWRRHPTRHDYWERDGGGLTGAPTSHLIEMFDHDDRCCMCGRWIAYGTSTKVDKKLRDRQACFGCSHLLDHVDHVGDDMQVVTDDGEHRRGCWIGSQTTSRPSHCRGHGGTKFTIAFDDGRVVDTVDLWCWAVDIPEYFFDLLPVNAKIVTPR